MTFGHPLPERIYTPAGTHGPSSAEPWPASQCWVREDLFIEYQKENEGLIEEIRNLKEIVNDFGGERESLLEILQRQAAALKDFGDSH